MGTSLAELVAGWFRGSTNRLILRAGVTVGVLSVTVKLVAMVKESAVAYRFGTGDSLDAFVVAFLLPALVINVIAGAVPSAFTPVYVEVRETQGLAAAHRLLGGAATLCAIEVVVVVLILAGAFPLALGVLSRSFSADKLALTQSLFLWLLPTIPLGMLASLLTASLNAEHRFAWAALVPVCVPLLALVGVVLKGGVWGVHALAAGTVFGCAVQCLALWVALRLRGLSVRPQWHGLTPELKRVAGQYGRVAGGTLLATGGATVAQAMAAMLPAGSVATLNYGSKIVAAITEIGSMAIATAVLPHFSLMVARREWNAIQRALSVYTRLLAMAAVPVTLLLMAFSGWIVQVLFQRGAFTILDSQSVAWVQVLLLIQVPFVMLGMLYVRLASALQRNDIQFWGAVVGLPVQVLLTIVLMRWMGVAGIALATSLLFIMSCTYLMIAVSGALRRKSSHLFSVDRLDPP